MNKIFLKPKQGVKAVDPETGVPLAETGEHKQDSAYWQRRVLDGDVIIETDTEGEEP